MKKFFLLLSAAVCALTMQAKVVFLDVSPTDWVTGNHNYYVWAWNSDGSTSIRMSQYSTTIYTAAVPNEFEDMLFVSMPDGYNTVDWDNYERQTEDLKVPTDGNNLFTPWYEYWDNDKTKYLWTGNWSLSDMLDWEELMHKPGMTTVTKAYNDVTTTEYWPYAEQWWKGYGAKSGVSYMDMYENTYQSVASYNTTIRPKEVNKLTLTHPGIFFSKGKAASDCYVHFDFPEGQNFENAKLYIEICPCEEEGFDYVDGFLQVKVNDIACTVPHMSLQGKLVGMIVPVDIPDGQIQTLHLACDNLSTQLFISKLWVVGKQPSPVCTYELEMRDSYGDGWNNNKLIVSDNGIVQEFEMVNADGKQKTVSVNAYGGTPQVKWEKGSFASEVGFTFRDANGVNIYYHEFYTNYEESFTLPDPCATRTIPQPVTNLNVTESPDNVFQFTWDAQAGIDRYYYMIFSPEGKLGYNGETDDEEFEFDAKNEEYNGAWTVSVAPADENGMPLIAGTTEAFLVHLPGMGNTTFHVRWADGTTMLEQAPVKIEVEDTDGKKVTGTMTKVEGKDWWEATLDITGPATSYIGVEVEEDATTRYKANAYAVSKDKDQCLAIDMYDGDAVEDGITYHLYYFNSLDCDYVLKNFTIKSATLTPGEGTINVKITPEEDASEYYILEVFTGSGDYYDGWPIEGTEAVVEVVNNEAVEVTSWAIYACNEYTYPVSPTYESTEGFTIKPNKVNITGLAATAVGDNTYKISWDVNKNAAQYYIYLYEATGTMILESTLYPEDLTKEGDKYVFISPKFAVEGTAKVVLWAGTENDWVLSVPLTFEVKDLKTFDEATLRILIPTDNNMNISGGVWIWWWEAGAMSGNLVQATEKETHWYEATFTVNAPGYQFLVVNRDVKTHIDGWSGAEQSDDSPFITEAQCCAELGYRDMDNSTVTKWPVYTDRGCEAKDHDYSATYALENTATGVKITITANEYAYQYRFSYKKDGSSSSTWSTWTYSADEEFTEFFNNDKDLNIEYYIMAQDKDNHPVSARQKGTFTVTANTCLATNLQRTVAADKQTVTFSWTPSTNPAVAYHTIEVYAPVWAMTLEQRAEGASLTVPFFISGEYEWYIVSYDKDNHALGWVQGKDFTITAPDYAPTDLKHSQNGNKVTLSWKAPEGVDFSWLYIWNETDHEDVFPEPLKLTGANGNYAYTYTVKTGAAKTYSWYVSTGKTADGLDIAASGWIDGDMFKGVDVATYTVTITAGKHGSIAPQEYVLEDVEEGAEITVKAVPDEGYTFTEWSDGETKAKRTFIVTGNIDVQAKFEKEQSAEYELTVEISPKNAGSVLFDGKQVKGNTLNVDDGTTVTLTAQPADGYEFDYYVLNKKEFTAPKLNVTVDKDITVQLYFKLKEAIDEIVNRQSANRKLIIDGQLYILRNGHTYSTMGARVE